jgi:eukaryotic-like serine/threonine-protein kinase
MSSLETRYEICEELGRGGMAVVYRAVDLRHKRDVAVKVMLQELTQTVGAERFLREIETAARLQHPHIVPVFDSGKSDDRLFFVMPLIEGESLRSRLQREKRLPVDEALRLVREVADALDYAHGVGVVHRDVKPENILLSRGHALLADFGIARAQTQSGTQALTRAGVSLGTPRYMSPEAAVGDEDIGPRSDVYALAAVLFELLTGEPPFDGRTNQQIVARQLTTDARRVRTLCPDVPPQCDEAIARALERVPEQRTQSARAFADALGLAAGQPATASVGDRSIVVLPFDNLSPDPNDAYLADGLTEEIIADLSRISALRVIARNSSVAAHQRTKDVKEIARMLDVRYVLEGSVRRAGDQLRITAQLIDGTSNAHLWAEKFRGTMGDVFAMQEDISRSIVEELRTRLTPEEASRPAPTTDAETYELYLRAKHMLGQSLTRIPEATPLLEEVMRRDPRFAPAYSALGAPLVLFAMFNYVEAKAAWAQIQALADRALAANPRSGPAHELLAAVAIYRDRNWSGARRLYARAAELEPGAGFDRFLYAFFQAFSGDVAGALESSREGRRLDPFSILGLLTESIMLAYQGRFDQALPLAERAVELDPHFPEGHHITGYILIGSRNFKRAETALRRAVELSGGAWATAKLGCALVGLGDSAEARSLMAQLDERAATDPAVSAPAVATLHLHLGNRDEYFRRMMQGIDARDPFALSLNREFLWQAARADPRFRELLERVNLPA